MKTKKIILIVASAMVVMFLASTLPASAEVVGGRINMSFERNPGVALKKDDFKIDVNVNSYGSVKVLPGENIRFPVTVSAKWNGEYDSDRLGNFFYVNYYNVIKEKKLINPETIDDSSWIYILSKNSLYPAPYTFFGFQYLSADGNNLNFLAPSEAGTYYYTIEAEAGYNYKYVKSDDASLTVKVVGSVDPDPDDDSESNTKSLNSNLILNNLLLKLKSVFPRFSKILSLI